jgi:hypothetical protein
MPVWKRVAVWVELVIALVLALLTLAVIYPNLGSVTRLPSGRQAWSQGDPLALTVYATILAACVAAVMVGQKRWRLLRVAGWVLLLVLFAGQVMKCC